MDVAKPYKSIGFGAMDVTKPYKSIGFGTAFRYRGVGLAVALWAGLGIRASLGESPSSLGPAAQSAGTVRALIQKPLRPGR